MPRRLCSEIQLFDLCERVECSRKDGRFCTDDELLARFESISEEEEPRVQASPAVRNSDPGEWDDDGFDDGYEEDDEYEDCDEEYDDQESDE